MNRHIPRPGEFYKHFKGKLYQIVALAYSAENMEEQVVYQALYDQFHIYVRSLEEFMSEVDADKYPNARQEFRFERYYFDEQQSETSIVPVRTTITPLADEQAASTIGGERYHAIENQRKELEGERRKHLENHVRGALEKQDQENEVEKD